MYFVDGLVGYIEAFKKVPGISINKVINFDNKSKIRMTEVFDIRKRYYNRVSYLGKCIKTDLNYDVLENDIISRMGVESFEVDINFKGNNILHSCKSYDHDTATITSDIRVLDNMNIVSYIDKDAVEILHIKDDDIRKLEQDSYERKEYVSYARSALESRINELTSEY